METRYAGNPGGQWGGAARTQSPHWGPPACSATGAPVVTHANALPDGHRRRVVARGDAPNDLRYFLYLVFHLKAEVEDAPEEEPRESDDVLNLDF